nr:cupin [Nocardioidaceae bacterium]
NRVTWRSVLVRAVGRLLTDPELDEPLPAGYHQEPRAFAASLHIQLMQLRNLLSDADPNELATAETAYFLSSRTATLRGALLDRVDLAAIGDSTGLRRRPGARLTTVADRNHLRLLLDDRELQVPGHLAPALRHVDQHHQLTPADLAGWLDSDSRLVLCRRLVREGLLEVVR